MTFGVNFWIPSFKCIFVFAFRARWPECHAESMGDSSDSQKVFSVSHYTDDVAYNW
jgi:hypothetical protein